MSRETRKISVNLPKSTDEKLQQIQDEESGNQTDAVVKSIDVYHKLLFPDQYDQYGIWRG